MSLHQLYCPELATGEVGLTREESHHALAVLRVRVGEDVYLFNGQGTRALATVVRTGRRQVYVEVRELYRDAVGTTRTLTLAVAPPRTPRQGILVEKCVELGAAALWPMRCARGVVQPTDALSLKWSRRAIEAAKQSERSYVPAVAGPQSFTEVLSRVSEFAAAAIADESACSAGPPPFAPGSGPNAQADIMAKNTKTNAVASEARSERGQDSRLPVPLVSFFAGRPVGDPLLILIGPEGGWSDTERHQAQEVRLTTVSLGPHVLRIETAAIAVCAAAALLPLGDPPADTD